MITDHWNQWKVLAGLVQPGQNRFASVFDSAESFAAAARTYLGAAQPAATAAEAAQAFGQVLREQSMVWFQPPWGAASPGGATPGEAPFEAPALGLTREDQQRWQRTAAAARRLAVAQSRLQCLWSDTLRDAAATFAVRVAAPGVAVSASADPASLRRLYDAWVDCAEEAYARTAHSDAFCDALAEFVNAGSQWRREFGATVEQWSKLLDLPTRSELNSLTRRLQAAEEKLLAERKEHPAAPVSKHRTAAQSAPAATPDKPRPASRSAPAATPDKPRPASRPTDTRAAATIRPASRPATAATPHKPRPASRSTDTPSTPPAPGRPASRHASVAAARILRPAPPDRTRRSRRDPKA